MADAAALTVRPAADMGAALAMLARAVPVAVGGCADVRDLARGCAVFDVADASGRAVAAFAVRVDTYSDGPVLTVTAAGGDSGGGAVAAIVAFCRRERERIGARAVLCETARPGLVRLLQRQGCRVGGWIIELGA